MLQARISIKRSCFEPEWKIEWTKAAAVAGTDKCKYCDNFIEQSPSNAKIMTICLRQMWAGNDKSYCGLK